MERDMSGDVALGGSSQRSIGSTVSDGMIDRREPHRERFEDDDSSGSISSDEEARHDQRADLARMTSRRSLAVVDGAAAGHHRLRSSSGTAAAAAAAQRVQNANTAGQHRPRRSSMTETSEVVPADEQRQSNQVVDFFRTVNKDAHQLKRLGSDGVQGCGGLLLGALASCLRRAGLGNPGAAVENMAFGTDDPLAISTKKATGGGVGRPRSSSAGAAAGGGRGGSGGGVSFVSGEFALEEELEEDDDEADQSELSAQKKKVHDLGELPALNWSNTSAKLLVTIVVVGVILLTTYSGWLDERVELGNFSLREWLNGLCVSVGAYFVIELLAKAVAGFFKWTRLLHTNNKVWIFIKLHKEVSLLIWSTIIYSLWTWFEGTDLAPEDNGVIAKILGVFVAYTATNVVSEVCKVEMAHRYMWKPYLERARASIWSQYVIFMMTDHAMGLQTKDTEGQALALGFTKTKKGDEHLSLYTVGKAIGFVHANALRHPLGPGRPGTDRDGMIDSKTGARLFGELLFDALMVHFNGEDLSKPLPIPPALSSSQSRDHPSPTKSKAVDTDLPRPFRFSKALGPAAAAVRPAADDVDDDDNNHQHHHSNGNTNNHHMGDHQQNMIGPRKLSCVPEEDEEQKEEGTGSDDTDADGSTSTETNDPRWSPGAEEPASQSAAAGDGTGAGVGTKARHVRSGGKRDSGGGGGGSAGGAAAAGRKGITLVHLRQMTSKPIALKMMELFEVPPEGVVTRKEFADRTVDIFVQRRSLQLTLGDYEAILTKVGYLLSVVSAVVIFFVALRILGYDIGSLVLTWLSLAVAFSFLFGSSASAFFESIVFVFVTKAYDVGDPVYFVDDTGGEDWYIVTRINMLTTVFRRWDGQATLIANNIMAKKAIRNQWRSSRYLHHTMIAVSVDTPMEKLDQMKSGIAAGLRRGRHRHRHGLGGLLPDTVDYQIKGLTDGNRLSVFVLCQQRENSANMGRRFGNSSLFHKLLARECNRHGISYTLPAQPLVAQKVGEVEAFNVREAFLGGETGR